MSVLNDDLTSWRFGQRLGKILLEAAKEDKREKFEQIKEAGYKEALKTMENWNSTDLSIIRVRDYLEALIDVDVKSPHIDEMDIDEFALWCERADEYEADKKKALISREGYEKWFIDKWFGDVKF